MGLFRNLGKKIGESIQLRAHEGIHLLGYFL